MITNKNIAKATTEHISCDSKYKFNSTVYKSNQTWNNKTCQCECRNYRTCKEDCSWNRSTYICENSKYLKSISVTECDEIIFVIHFVSTKKTNVTSTASTNCHSIKVRDCYILHTVLSYVLLFR